MFEEIVFKFTNGFYTIIKYSKKSKTQYSIHKTSKLKDTFNGRGGSWGLNQLVD